MKKVPNTISIIRILLSIALLFTKPFGTVFLVIYVMCGLSDILDGYLARKYQVASKTGEVLDSIGDTVMVGVILWILFPVAFLPKWVWIWIAVIALVRISAIVVSFYRFHIFSTLHTYGNKVSGFLLFLCLPFYYMTSSHVLAGILCIVAMVSAVEELLIQLTSQELLRNVKGIFFKQVKSDAMK